MTGDPYYILGVARGATQDEVKKAFHKLAHQHHPDKGGNAEVFKKISWAYAELKNIAPVTREAEPEWDNPYTRDFGNVHFYEAADFRAQNAMSQEWTDGIIAKWVETYLAQMQAQQRAQQDSMRRHGPINPNEYQV